MSGAPGAPLYSFRNRIPVILPVFNTKPFTFPFASRVKCIEPGLPRK